jgi:hypothetical protein
MTTLTNLSGAFRHAGGAHFLVVHRRHVNVNVDAIHERPGNLRNVALDHGRRAVAFTGAVVVKAARTGIHGRGQHETRRKSQRHGGARNAHRAILQRLAHHLEHITREFGELIEKEHAVVGQRNSPGRGTIPPPIKPASEMV